jgi:KDO2-lipid IV(A) lauroyltransferase
MKDRLSASAYFLGWAIVRKLPERVAYGLFARIGRQMVARNGSSVQRLRFNLSRVSKDISQHDLDELVLTAMDSYMRYWCDTFRIQDWSTERIQKSVSLENGNLLLDAMKEGRGVVIALPHSGNWDHAGAYFCSIGIPLVTVAERLKPEALFQKFLEYRQSMGFEVLALDTRSFATLLKRAREKRLIALVADRDLSRSGIDVDFFGHQSRMPAGPALLAIRTGIPLVVAHVSYRDSGIHIKFHEVPIPFDGDETERISTVVQRCADLFAQGIAEHPEDWHMLQRIWIDGDFKERD